MLKACRRVVLATGVLSLLSVAQADCPPEESIDRYTQTAGDALTALHELVPESQQRALEDRYAAMVIMKWQWQGRAAIVADRRATEQLLSCYLATACGMRASDQITVQIASKLEQTGADPLSLENLLPAQPNANAVSWARRILKCDRPPAPAIIPEAFAEPETIVATTDNPGNDVDLLDRNAVASETAGPFASSDVLESAQLLPDTPQNDPIMASVEPALTLGASVSADIAPAIIAAAGTNTDELMLTATNLVFAGKPMDAIEPLETACFIEAQTVEKSAACETLFDVFTNALVAQDFSSNSRVYLELSQNLCAIGYSRGCDNLSRYYAAQGSADAHLAAVAYAERSCELANAEACATVASFYLAGRASEPDPAAARRKLEESCQLGRLMSCQDVADFYLRGIGGEADPATALRMVEASCPATGAERADLCVSAADFILIHEQSGPARSTRVRTFIKRACEIGHDVGCAWYAEDLELGIGGDVDLAAARQARLTACEYGDQKSCNSRS